MATGSTRRWATFLRRATLAAIGLGVAAFLFAWSGAYNVAASSGHWAIVEWFLRFGMSNSVSLRANPVAAPPLDNPDLVKLGAGHFEIGCAFCHGSPIGPASKVTDQMLPAPPALTHSARAWKDHELFWIVRHGIKYTGMPGWVAIERDDEIWAVVAFLKQLPAIDDKTYRTLAFGRTEPPPDPGEPTVARSGGQPNVALCARCHGDGSDGPPSALVPILHGQPAAFLARAMREYAAGERRSGIMQPIAADLDRRQVENLAAHYAGLAMPPPRRPPNVAAEGLIERGRTLALEGDVSIAVPACIACHGRDALATYPRLDGQHTAYIAKQLRVWKAGHNAGTSGTAIMAPIARRLDDKDIEAVAAYFAQVPATATAPPKAIP